MSKIFGAFVFLAFAALTLGDMTLGSHRRAAFEVCDLVEKHYFKRNEIEVQAWLEKCRQRASEQPYLVSKKRIIFEINSVLSELAVSHLFLYTPDENRSIWENESVDTGIRARNIEGEVIIFEVLPGSVAAEAKLKRGDQIVLLNDQPVGQTSTVEWTPGYYTILRGRDRFSVDLQPRSLAVDLAPQFLQLENGVAVVRAQSFLAQYFSDENIRPIAVSLQKSKKAVLDLRSNTGGSFPAMLRMASALFCKSELLGTLEKSSTHFSPLQADLEDDLSAKNQIQQLDRVARLNLRAYAGYPCFAGPLTVLVDSDTASTAEILAEALLSRPRTRVWGMPTAGQVVMARWFPVRSLGPGDFSVSVPIAGYRSVRGATLEEDGMTPQKFLYYRNQEMKRGRDSWLSDSIEFEF